MLDSWRVRLVVLLIAVAGSTVVGMSLSSLNGAPVLALTNLTISGTTTLQGLSSLANPSSVGANVVAVSLEDGKTSTTTVAADGTFIVTDLAGGRYQVDVQAPGFIPAQIDDLDLGSSSAVLPDISLRGGLVDSDASVGILDFSAMSASFGQAVSGRVDDSGRVVDINGDGVVSILDISLAASNFGVTGAATPAGSVATSTPIKAPLGTNIGVYRYWIAETPFVDIFKGSAEWIPSESLFTGDFDSGVPVPLRDDGYPVEVPFTASSTTHVVKTLMYTNNNWDYPLGDYTVIYEGDGDIAFDWGAGGDIFTAPGTYTVNVTSRNDFGFILGITRSNVNDPVRNIRVILPGFAGVYQTEPFHPEYVDVLDDFSVVRFTEWAPVIVSGDFIGNTATTTWANRVLPNDAHQSTEQGVAYEYIADLSNLAGVDPWLSIPHRADDDYITQLATFMLARLDPDRTVYVEYSNEVWNRFDFPFSIQQEWASSRGLELGLSTDPLIAGYRYTARRSAEIFELFEAVWGSESDRLVNVLASFTAQPAITTEILTTFHQAQVNGVDVNPNGVAAEAMAVGPYFGGDIADTFFNAGQADSVTVEQILDELEQDLIDDAETFINQSAAAIAPFNIPMVAYEGGQSLWARMPESIAHDVLVGKLNEANRRDRMYDIYQSYFDIWYQAGGQLFLHYNTIHTYDRQHSFGSLEAQDQDVAAAPKHRALLEIIEEFETGLRTLSP